MVNVESNAGEAEETNGRTYQSISRKSSCQIANYTAGADCQTVRKLGLYVINMMALRTGRGHNRRIGNRRQMIAGYRASQNCCHCHGEQIHIMTGYRYDNRNQNTKCTPGSTGSKGKANKNTTGSKAVIVALPLITWATYPPRSR